MREHYTAWAHHACVCLQLTTLEIVAKTLKKPHSIDSRRNQQESYRKCFECLKIASLLLHRRLHFSHSIVLKSIEKLLATCCERLRPQKRFADFGQELKEHFCAYVRCENSIRNTCASVSCEWQSTIFLGLAIIVHRDGHIMRIKARSLR